MSGSNGSRVLVDPNTGERYAIPEELFQDSGNGSNGSGSPQAKAGGSDYKRNPSPAQEQVNVFIKDSGFPDELKKDFWFTQILPISKISTEKELHIRNLEVENMVREQILMGEDETEVYKNAGKIELFGKIQNSRAFVGDGTPNEREWSTTITNAIRDNRQPVEPQVQGGRLENAWRALRGRR